MSNDPKMFALDVLRREYKAFMEKVMQIPGVAIPKQQAAFRFEEGHMWMQQAIIHFVEQQPVPPVPEVPEAGSESVPVEPVADSAEVAEPIQPESLPVE